MATKEQLKSARELLDLDVKEVSLVDKPANLREFLIVKRRAESNLGEYELEPSVVEWLEKMAGAPGAPTESILALAAVLTGGEPVADSKANVDAQDPIEPGQAAKPEPATEPVAKAEPETPPAAAEPETKPETPPTTEPVAKAEPETPPEEPPMVVVKQDGSIHVAGQTVQKAKTFGKAKTATLQNAVQALAKLLGDVSEDALKSAMAPYMDPTKKVEKAAEPAELEPTPTADPTELITKAVTAALEPISKRIEAIEKTRNPSHSVEGDGGTDTNTPVEKSLWSGIL